ncbi:MAG: hypothetical protein AAB426_10095 [Myxococcota bacterium]
MAVKEIEGNQPTEGRSRTQRLVDMFQRLAGTAEPADPMTRFANKIRDMLRAEPGKLTTSDYRLLLSLVREVNAQTAAAEGSANAFAQHQAAENAKAQMRGLTQSLEPPPELVDTPEHVALLRELTPETFHTQQSSFERQTLLRGKVRTDVLNRQVNDAVQEASKLAAERVLSARHAHGDALATGGTTLTLAQRVRQLRLRKKKRKREVKNADAIDATDEPAEITPAEVDELATLALETMRILREEMAPRWAPDQQPWLLQAADREVFDIILAVIPRELFEETAAFQGIQDLRSRQGVLTLRAADRTTEAVRRR